MPRREAEALQAVAVAVVYTIASGQRWSWDQWQWNGLSVFVAIHARAGLREDHYGLLVEDVLAQELAEVGLFFARLVVLLFRDLAA